MTLTRFSKISVIVMILLFLTISCPMLLRSAGVIPTRELMKVKLDYSQAILEGLVKEDFGMISGAAEKLDRLSQAETWPVRQTEEYKLFTVALRRNAQKLVEAAEARSIDSASLAYFQVTQSCINCHTYLKGVQRASLW